MPIRVLSLLLGLVGSTILSFYPSHLDAQAFQAQLDVALLLPTSGALASYGKDFSQGADLSLNLLQKTNPDLAKRIVIVKRNTQGKADEAERIARTLVTTRQADIIIPSITSNTATTVIDAIGSSMRPILVPYSAGTKLNERSENVYLLNQSDSVQGAMLAQFAVSDLKAKTAVMVIEKDSSYASAIATEFEKKFNAAGGKILSTITYTKLSAEISSIVATLKDKRADVILNPGFFKDAAELITKSKEQGVLSTFLGGDGWDSPQLFELAQKSAMDGHYFLSGFSTADTDPNVQAFVNAYRSAYGSEPSGMAALGYNTMQVVIDAFSRAKSELATALHAALKAPQDYQGATGTMRFDQQRVLQRPLDVMKTSFNEARFVKRVDVAL